MRNELLPIGLNKFKLSGRNSSLRMVIENYTRYFVKPEFQDEIRLELIIRNSEYMGVN